MSDTLIWLSEQTGKRYVRTDKANRSTLAKAANTPTVGHRIPIKGDYDSNSGELGIVKVVVTRDTEIAVLYPKRGGAHDPRNASIISRPHYYLRDAANKKYRVYKVQCSQCAFYQRRDAFSPDSRKRNGLASVCRECHNANMRRAYQLAIAA